MVNVQRARQRYLHCAWLVGSDVLVQTEHRSREREKVPATGTSTVYFLVVFVVANGVHDVDLCIIQAVFGLHGVPPFPVVMDAIAGNSAFKRRETNSSVVASLRVQRGSRARPTT